MPWPTGTTLLVGDLARDMLLALRGQWHGDAAVGVNANWLRLPLAATSIDAIVGDGALTVLPGQVAVTSCVRELARVLRPGGVLALRLFCPPPVAEQTHAVIADALAARVGGFHAWKWRLVMAMHAQQTAVTLGDIWRLFAERVADRDALARATGWSRAAIDTVDAYRDASARYSFVGVDALAALMAPDFALDSVAHGSYELADRCPVVRFVRR